jgi:hypothetical protein
MSPETTGETENGRSMSVVSTLLPRKSNLAIAHAAAMPNTRLRGTAITAASSVSRIADHASGSLTAAAYTAQPFLSASKNTAKRGTKRKSVRYARASPMRMTGTHAILPLPWERAGVRVGLVMTAAIRRGDPHSAATTIAAG